MKRFPTERSVMVFIADCKLTVLFAICRYISFMLIIAWYHDQSCFQWIIMTCMIQATFWLMITGCPLSFLITLKSPFGRLRVIQYSLRHLVQMMWILHFITTRLYKNSELTSTFTTCDRDGLPVHLFLCGIKNDSNYKTEYLLFCWTSFGKCLQL